MASRTKIPGYTQPQQSPTRSSGRTPLILGVVAVAVVIVGIVAVVATRDTSGPAADGTGAAAAQHASQETAGVRVSGAELPAYPKAPTGALTDPSTDPAVGSTIPGLTGQSFDGSDVVVDPADGRPKVILFVAHWCPHCQAEVPLLQQWIADGNLPDGVDVVTVSTAVDESRPNYPPSKWIAREGWQPPVLLDDNASTAANVFGLPGYPYFVLTDGTGKVVQRGSGEVPIADFATAVDALAATSPDTTSDAG